MGLSSGDPERLIVITEYPDRLPADIRQMRIIRRPDILAVDQEHFLDELRGWFHSAATKQARAWEDEPMRLFRAGEYRPAVISAITLLESALADRLGVSKSSNRRVTSLNQMLNIAGSEGLFSNYDADKINTWLRVRNEAVHRPTPVPMATARGIIDGVIEILIELKRR